MLSSKKTYKIKINLSFINDGCYKVSPNYLTSNTQQKFSSLHLLTTADHLPPSHPMSSTPTLCTSSFCVPMNILCGLPVFLPPCSSLFHILSLIYPPSLLCTCPNYLSLASFNFISKLLNLSCLSDVLTFYPSLKVSFVITFLKFHHLLGVE